MIEKKNLLEFFEDVTEDELRQVRETLWFSELKKLCFGVYTQ